MSRPKALALFVLLVVVGCHQTDADDALRDAGSDAAVPSEPIEGKCVAKEGAEAPDFLPKLGCRADFDLFASRPFDSSIPGARSVKVVLDRYDDKLYFQNSQRYPIHYQFVRANIEGVASLVANKEDFDDTQYTSKDRRFILGAVTYYEEPNAWVLELATIDNASADMITKLFRAVADAAYFGTVLQFHPGTESLAETAAGLPEDVPVLTTEALYEGIDYQPLNLGTAAGKLRIMRAAELATTYVSYRDIVVLDEVPNDISVVAGMITSQFQTPLSHVNVLAQNRGTPNMGLRGASENAKLEALDGKWVELTVGAFEWSIKEVTQAQADKYWAEHRPTPVELPPVNLEVTELRDIQTVTEHQDTVPYVTREAITTAVAAFGAKAANYSVFSTDDEIPSKPAFAIPLRHYVDFMTQNGIFERVKALRADPTFTGDPMVRDLKLKELRDAIRAGEFDAKFTALLKAKLDKDFPGKSMRYRSSTNSEDLSGFPCAGCYDSHTGDPADHAGDQMAAALDAIRKTWATVWSLRTYEEREYHGIDHLSVAMALLVHTNFPDEEANGVAITGNPFDPSGNTPGFYVNVQEGGLYEVVAPPPGVTSDSFVYEFDRANQPIHYITHSSELPEGETTVLTTTEIHTLGVALEKLHERFAAAYAPEDGGVFAMDVEFKFDDDGTTSGVPELYIKQARPYRGRGR